MWSRSTLPLPVYDLAWSDDGPKYAQYHDSQMYSLDAAQSRVLGCFAHLLG